jgi:hypothetical protein
MQIPAPGFEVGGWHLVLQARLFLTLKSETVDKLVHIYNRMRGANEQRDKLLDLVDGGSVLAMRVVDAAASSVPGGYPTEVAKVVDEFGRHRDTTRDGLLRRVEDMKPFLDDAIDAIAAELGKPNPTPSARIIYRHTKLPDRLN